MIHDDGYIEIRDRAKDVIIMDHPSVLECAVVARPDDTLGEVPKAFVIAFCSERLRGFKTPKAVEFCDLPKTSTGKIQKFVLREREWAGRTRRVN